MKNFEDASLDDESYEYDIDAEAEAERPARRPRAPVLVTVFSDEHLHAISKPAGLSSVSERWNPRLPTAMKELWRQWLKNDPDALRPHLVHRLDKDTTGVLLFARHRDAQVELRRQFREREVKKTYLALVRGAPEPRTGHMEFEIAPDQRQPGRMRVVKRGGKVCITDYETIEVFRDFALLRVRPLTGRTHQVRVTLALAGTPCAVDPTYGGATALYLSAWKPGYKTGRGEAEPPVIGRLTLHAETLTIVHPAHKTPLVIEAPLPKDLAATLRHLRRWQAT